MTRTSRTHGRRSPHVGRKVVSWAVALLAASALVPADGAATNPVTVFAASSLTEALEDVAAALAPRGIHLRFSFAASSLLARQIEEGAPADVFCSADAEWMDRLEQRSLIAGESRRSVIGNRLVLIAPVDAQSQAASASDPAHPAATATPHAPAAAAPAAPRAPAAGGAEVIVDAGFPLLDRLGNGRLALGDPSHVPAGRYAQQAMMRLGLWELAKDRLAPSQNVRAALAMVEQGQASLGIVYATDASASRGVVTVAVFPDDSHEPIEYPMARIAGRQRAEIDRFFDFVTGEHGREIFRRRGFTIR
ncbi:MAG TPA: molybdate ABC transporter substrate-binding protein [Candidatus Limnocylindrales bacterium]|nr:molybdate ABC transporter substrate-binding protein [Candidatus Limnocylindrales bacterium]